MKNVCPFKKKDGRFSGPESMWENDTQGTHYNAAAGPDISLNLSVCVFISMGLLIKSSYPVR